MFNEQLSGGRQNPPVNEKYSLTEFTWALNPRVRRERCETPRRDKLREPAPVKDSGQCDPSRFRTFSRLPFVHLSKKLPKRTRGRSHAPNPIGKEDRTQSAAPVNRPHTLSSFFSPNTPNLTRNPSPQAIPARPHQQLFHIHRLPPLTPPPIRRTPTPRGPPSRARRTPSGPPFSDRHTSRAVAPVVTTSSTTRTRFTPRRARPDARYRPRTFDRLALAGSDRWET